MSSLVLYGVKMSPPVRAVLLTLRALKLDYKFKEINIAAGENLKPEYLAKNPQHTVPALEDGELMLWDSHAICAYLVRKYGSDNDDSPLYPKDFSKRALVDQRLHYESGILFHTCLKQITKPLFYENANQIPKEKVEQIHEAYALLETFLGKKQQYMAGEGVTIADFSIVSTVSSFDVAIAAVDGGKYPQLAAWLERMTKLPYYGEANLKGAQDFGERVKSKLPKQFDKLWQKAIADIKSGKQ